jgi:hypothetical protein
MNERYDPNDNGHDGMTDEQRASGTAALAEAAARDDADDEEREAPRNETRTDAPRMGGEQSGTPLFTDEASDDYRSRWNDVQSRFVDDPRDAVKEADSLVADLMKDLAKSFADERSNLENQWSRGDDASTEDLRVALQRYRSFFGRLLSI